MSNGIMAPSQYLQTYNAKLEHSLWIDTKAFGQTSQLDLYKFSYSF